LKAKLWQIRGVVQLSGLPLLTSVFAKQFLDK
jgi:hypothetical protein